MGLFSTGASVNGVAVVLNYDGVEYTISRDLYRYWATIQNPALQKLLLEYDAARKAFNYYNAYMQNLGNTNVMGRPVTPVPAGFPNTFAGRALYINTNFAAQYYSLRDRLDREFPMARATWDDLVSHGFVGGLGQGGDILAAIALIAAGAAFSGGSSGAVAAETGGAELGVITTAEVTVAPIAAEGSITTASMWSGITAGAETIGQNVAGTAVAGAVNNAIQSEQSAPVPPPGAVSATAAPPVTVGATDSQKAIAAIASLAGLALIAFS